MASSLATRCTACGTVFRVVPDQLRVSEGWVRCGRCSEVFNAAEHLVDAQSGAPRQPGDAPPQVPSFAAAPPRPPERLYDPHLDDGYGDALPPPAYAEPDVRTPAPHEEPAAPAPLPVYAPSHEALHEPLHEQRVDHWQDDSGFGHTQQEATPVPAPVVATSERFEPHIGDSIISLSSSVAHRLDVDGLDDLHDLRAMPREPEALPVAGIATPSFLRQADRAQRWKQPRVRVALWALTVLAGLGLVAQVLFVYRDLAAARFVLLRPALEQACGVLGCSVGEAHAIDSLVVESSGLVRVEKSSVYRFSVALRNRAAIAVAVPAVEIALTDAQGKLLARRVLRATELGSTQPALAAGRDLALQATLQAATEPVTGYTIELFYP